MTGGCSLVRGLKGGSVSGPRRPRWRAWRVPASGPGPWAAAAGGAEAAEGLLGPRRIASPKGLALNNLTACRLNRRKTLRYLPHPGGVQEL